MHRFIIFFFHIENDAIFSFFWYDKFVYGSGEVGVDSALLYTGENVGFLIYVSGWSTQRGWAGGHTPSPPTLVNVFLNIAKCNSMNEYIALNSYPDPATFTLANKSRGEEMGSGRGRWRDAKKPLPPPRCDLHFVRCR